MATQGTPKSFLKSYKFLIECDRLGDTAFQKCSEFESTVEMNEYAEGGSIFNEKDAGRLSFTNVTLTRGQTVDDNDMYNWHLEVGSAGDDIGGVGDAYKANMDIVNQQRDGAAGRRYRLFTSWPMRVKEGPWDNESSDHSFAEAEIVFNYGIIVPL